MHMCAKVLRKNETTKWQKEDCKKRPESRVKGKMEIQLEDK